MRMYQFKTGSGDVFDLDKISMVYDTDHVEKGVKNGPHWWSKKIHYVKQYTTYHMIFNGYHTELEGQQAMEELKTALMDK